MASVKPNVKEKVLLLVDVHLRHKNLHVLEHNEPHGLLTSIPSHCTFRLEPCRCLIVWIIAHILLEKSDQVVEKSSRKYTRPIPNYEDILCGIHDGCHCSNAGSGWRHESAPLLRYVSRSLVLAKCNKC
jgi:hypothetical protein